MYDPEGRWQALADYSNTYNLTFCNASRLVKYGIEDDEIGEIEAAAFNIIRLRNLPDLPKAHVIMRNLPKYCGTPKGKKEIKKIAREVNPILSYEEQFDKDGNPLKSAVIDTKWAAMNRESIIYHTKRAALSHEIKVETETPISLLEAAYKKLTHDNMDLETIKIGDLKTARGWVVQIMNRAKKLEKQIYHREKELKKIEKLSGKGQ